ncbi:hypothetical protein EDD63_10123 [Breznakia blatticola]|uniref:Uncharacterized protein n=1 Tax=Breznakia blatticola TaxID=1754012 RepID=A0A4R8A750_9FIRM|nr:hypothetical protein [Breznakia blatticola]TDW26309.1 hypothetical protein EDD63_10123 [Breznakia blatticola]
MPVRVNHKYISSFLNKLQTKVKTTINQVKYSSATNLSTQERISFQANETFTIHKSIHNYFKRDIGKVETISKNFKNLDAKIGDEIGK